jgi:iron complex transport system substrate-binding protein
VKGKGVVSGGRSDSCIPYSDAGAISLRADLGVKEISVEQLIKWNPDVLFIIKGGGGRQSITIEQVLGDPQLQTVNAVKTGSVYYITGRAHCEVLQRVMTGAMYMAKIFYPDKFKDLDVEKEGNEIFERFFGGDDIFSEYADTVDGMGYLREFINNPPEEGKWQDVPE